MSARSPMCWAFPGRIELFRSLPAVLRGDGWAGLTRLGGDSPSLVTFWVCVVATEGMLIAICVLATEFLHKAKQAKDVAIEDLRDAISFSTRWRHTASPIWPRCTSGLIPDGAR